MNNTTGFGNLTTDDDGWDDLYDPPLEVVILLSLCYGSISVAAVVGNGLVIWVILTSRRMRNVTNYYIANLALADIAIGLFAIPFEGLSRCSEVSKTEIASESAHHKVTPKVERGELLQSENAIRISEDVLPSMTESDSAAQTKEKGKKKRKKRLTIDPLRPTKKRSFGVDIGQGINAIKYIKENCCPISESRANRLMNLFEKPLPTLKTEKSMETVYRVLPLSQELSRTALNLKKEQSWKSSERAIRDINNLFNESEDDMFKVRYRDYAVELPNDYGIDDLQALFVPYRLTSEH